MFLDILKTILTLLGGGLAGAILNEWFRRRRAGVQRIPLIERVNRVVGPELKGVTLARVVGSHANRKLEEIRNVREYQLSLRNTSSIHLQDVEIQFESSTEDVEAWASRPALSKTAPVPVDAEATDPWRRAFRWRIPRLPSTDSIEFTFRAVNPPSGDYEVALYNADRVVIERSEGEPAVKRSSVWEMANIAALLFGMMAGVLIMVPGVMGLMGFDKGSNFTSIGDTGCTLAVF